MRIAKKPYFEKYYNDGRKRLKQAVIRNAKQQKPQVEVVDVFTTKTKVNIFLASMLISIAGFGIGYGLSLVTPDGNIRANSITSTIATSLARISKDEIKGVSISLPVGYTKEQIEDNYLLKYNEDNIDGVSAEKEASPNEAFDLASHTTLATITKSYLSKSTLNANTLYLASNSSNGIALTDVTNDYQPKSNFAKGNIYEVTGVGVDEALVDVTSSYISKADYSDGSLYLASGSDDFTQLTLTNEYWSKSSFTLGHVYDIRNTAAGITREDITSRVIAKSSFVDGNVYLVTDNNGVNNYEDKTSDYIEINTFPKKDYVYVGSGSSGASALAIPKTITSLDEKIKKFQIDKISDPKETFPVNIPYQILRVLNRYLPNYAKLTPTDLTTILANPTKYKFRLFVGDSRLNYPDRIETVTSWSGAKLNDFTSINKTPYGDFNSTIAATYTYTLKFAASDAPTLMWLRCVAENAINANCGIKGLQVYNV